MSISSEISRIAQNVSDSLDAVAAKGVTVPTGSTSDDLPDLIAQISGGGTISIVDTPDSNGGNVRTITAINTISGTKSITENGTGIDVAAYALVDVAVPVGEEYPTFTIIINASYVAQSATCDKTYAQCDGYYDDMDYYAHAVLTAEGAPISMGAVGSAFKDQNTGTISYYVEFNHKGVSDYRIDYASNGTITVTNTPIPFNDSTDLTASTLTVTAPSGYYESNATKTLSDANLVAGNIKKNVTIFGVTGSYEGSTGKNWQITSGEFRRGSTTLGDTGLSLTVAVSGTYNVYWSAFRSNTSNNYTNGTQLYIGSSSYGTENTSWSNTYNQANMLTGVQLTKDQVLHIYARSRGNSYYVSVANLVIEQTA